MKPCVLWVYQLHQRAANPVISSGCRVVPGFSLCNAPALISLALSLALSRSDCRNVLPYSSLELVPVVGLEPTRLFMVPGF